MDSISSRQVLIGLPKSGKTTFLAALWHVVTNDNVGGSLKLERLHGNSSHLNKICDLWADANPLERTATGGEKFVSMILRSLSGGTSTEIFFPDLAGESFERQWTLRLMSKECESFLKESDGGLLMIHPEEVTKETLISEANPIIDRIAASSAATIGEPEQDQETLGSADVSIEEEWNPEKTPKQIQLVELLQFLMHINQNRPLKLAVAISAWDLVTDIHGSGISPTAWANENLPLLMQFLKSNFETYQPHFFGLSAQGGKLDDAESLRKKIIPSERIRVVPEGGSESNDITIPVQWIME